MLTVPDSAVIRVGQVTKYFQLSEGNGLQEQVFKWLLRRPTTSRTHRALHDISFSVAAGEAVAIVGRNGSGKSTLLKLLAGIIEPSEGDIWVSGRICTMLGQGAGFYGDLTGRENVKLKASLLGLSDRQVKERFDEIVDFAELRDFIDTPVKRYSSGMAARLSFAVAIHSDPDILLADEVLAVGDADFREKCVARMKQLRTEGVTILMASHNMNLVRQFCDRAILLREGCLVCSGEPKEVIEMHTQNAVVTKVS